MIIYGEGICIVLFEVCACSNTSLQISLTSYDPYDCNQCIFAKM